MIDSKKKSHTRTWVPLDNFGCSVFALLYFLAFNNYWINLLISGYLKDAYGTFDLTFYLSGSLIVVGGLMMLLIPVKNQLTYDKKKTIELTIDVNNSSDV